MKRYKAVLACLLAASVLFGCGKKEEPKEPEVKKEEPVQEEEPEEVVEAEKPDTEQIPDGMVKSYLTGEYVSETIGKRRPVAVMLNNIQKAVPQAGIANAGVVYEAPVEGGITRLMGIFEDYDNLTKIGSVRSCRDYYIYYALEFDAIYAHYGQAAYALPYLDLEQVNNLNGLSGYGGDVYYRTKDRKAPHNAYTSFEGLQKGIEINKYSQDYASDYKGHYQFAKAGETVSLENASPAAFVRLHYKVNDPWFEYHEDDGLYYRFQYGEPQIDELTNEQLAYKNIIIQYSPWEYYPDGSYLNVDTLSGGKGKYITNGQAIDITWTKNGDEWGPTRYYDSLGNEITMNTGKTWVCIVQDTEAANVEVNDGTNAEQPAPQEIDENLDAE
jgi:hypothetical protein